MLVTSSRPPPARGPLSRSWWWRPPSPRAPPARPFADLGGGVLAGRSPLPLVHDVAGPVRGVIACVERAGSARPVAVLLVAGGLADGCLRRGAVRQDRQRLFAFIAGGPVLAAVADPVRRDDQQVAG